MSHVVKAVLRAIIAGKRARLDAASGYIANTSLQLECRLLRAEIEALEKELQ